MKNLMVGTHITRASSIDGDDGSMEYEYLQDLYLS